MRASLFLGSHLTWASRQTSQLHSKEEDTEDGEDRDDDGFVWADADVEEMLNGADAADDGCEGAGAAGGKCI